MYTMKQACQAAGMSYETLKFYCNEGLVPNVKRSANNYRIFDDHDINWIKSLSCLKRCGMSIAEMKEYLALCLEGEKTIPQRKLVLSKHKDELQMKIRELEDAVRYIEWKESFYDDVLSGRKEYHSDLIGHQEH
ncbi:MAG: MerR family transcriptional regulator [Merdibacter sp.]|nr:MerR family transcriptional regulator [Merdibacter sp.]